MKKKNPSEERLQSILIKIVSIKSALPKSISSGAFSIKAKIPSKVHLARETIGYRVLNLSETAYDLIQKDEFVPALILIRSILESTAVLYTIKENVANCLEKENIGDFDDTIMRVIFGSRDKSTSLEAVNVLTMIDKWDKKTKLVRKIYNDLCEFSHPNCSGVEASYGIIDKEKLLVKLGKNTNRNSYPFDLAITSLDIVLEYFIVLYDEIIDLLKDFAKLCEKELEENN